MKRYVCLSCHCCCFGREKKRKRERKRKERKEKRKTDRECDLQEVDLNQEIVCRNGTCETSLLIEQPSDTGRYSCCTSKQVACTPVYIFATGKYQFDTFAF